MSRAWDCLLARLSQFRRDHHGVAAVEFALVLPVMLVLYIGAMETSMVITMDRKVQSVAGAVGDLVARTEGNISADQLRDYFQASSGIMTPYATTDLKQLVTLIEILPSGKTNVVWSREYFKGLLSIGTTRKANTPYPLPAQMVTISQNSDNKYVVASEALASYSPLSGLVFNKAVPLYRENFFTPRSGKTITTDATVK
jgi:Flp pilus assembly protein TadG